jgi:hypothetical protein
MNLDDWQAEGKLRNGGVRVRHLRKRCVFDVWQQGEDVRAVLRQGAAGNDLFEEAKEWFRKFGQNQPSLL